jgi:hypothetical protein
MIFKHILFLLSVLVVTAFAAQLERKQITPVNDRFRCINSNMPPPQPFHTIANVTAAGNSSEASTSAESLVAFTVPLYIHIVDTTTSASVSDATIRQQLIALNANYAPTLIQFDLRNVSRSINNTWATASTLEIEQEMKQQLRRGGYDSLNLYFLLDWNPLHDEAMGFNSTFGFCTYPELGNINKTVLARDGCIMQQYSMPGSPGIGRTTVLGGSLDEGKTAVYEVGHWLNLIHVFGANGTVGRCIEDDFVFDTPLQFQASPMTVRGTPCPPPKVSCPGVSPSSIPGPDNVFNFLDYSSDYCMREFTPGQAVRMNQAWRERRVGRAIAAS